MKNLEFSGNFLLLICQTNIWNSNDFSYFSHNHTNRKYFYAQNKTKWSHLKIPQLFRKSQRYPDNEELLRKLFDKAQHFVESILTATWSLIMYNFTGDISRFTSQNSGAITGEILRRSKRDITRVDSTFRIMSLEENDFLHLDSCTAA